jgi:hypothetical protein
MPVVFGLTTGFKQRLFAFGVMPTTVVIDRGGEDMRITEEVNAFCKAPLLTVRPIFPRVVGSLGELAFDHFTAVSVVFNFRHTSNFQVGKSCRRADSCQWRFFLDRGLAVVAETGSRCR